MVVWPIDPVRSTLEMTTPPNAGLTLEDQPPPGFSASGRRWLWLGLGLLLLLLLNLGSRGLNESDEGRYSNIAEEMLEGVHGWWEPRMSDYLHYDKPPMTYWVTAISFESFGRNEWAARVTPLLGAAMALVGLGWAAWRLYGERVAWWSVFFCGTMVQFVVLARVLTPDMLLTGFVTLGIACWAESRQRNGSLLWWVAMLACWAGAWWTKATAALVPLLALSVGLLLTGDRPGLRALRPLRLLVLIIVTGAPWYVNLMKHHPELEGFFLGRELAGRVVGHPDGRHGGIYFHAVVGLVGWAPWWPWMMFAALKSIGRLKQRIVRQRWRALPWELWLVLIGVTVFSLISSKLPAYTLPFAPWAALLSARVLSRNADSRSMRPALVTGIALAVVFAGVTFGLPKVESRLGASSSMREVAGLLKQEHADAVYLDRYMAGMEFYFGENVFYVTDDLPRQLFADDGFCQEIGEPHFVLPARVEEHLAQHSAMNCWLVRYRARETSPLTFALAKTHSLEHVTVGDFVLDQVSGEPR